MTEAQLFPIVAKYLENQGYKVQGEVNECDLVAIKGEEIVIVELKRSFNVKLLYQATRRLSITNKVYGAVFKPQARQKPSFYTMLRSLSRRLEIGLFMVVNDTVQVISEPGPFKARASKKKREALLKEFHGRRASNNIGGINKIKINTAYLESAIHLAVLMYRRKSQTAQQLRARGASDNAYGILYHNHYGWFERVEKGHYALRKGIMKDIKKRHSAIVKYYQKLHAKVKK